MTTEITPNLGLPLLHAAQAQKEITHNEALLLIDALLCGVVSGPPTNTPPADPQAGSLWIVGAEPTGIWASNPSQLALWCSNGWRFVDPPSGTHLRLSDGRSMLRLGAEWELGIIKADGVRIGNYVVLGPRQAAISAPSGGSVVDSQARLAIESILVALIGHGLIH